MQLDLYDPEFGYYMAGMQKFGREGDFVTAPLLSPLFGQSIANQCAELLQILAEPIIFEFGGGTGRLSVDILKQLQSQNNLPKAYHILEISPELKLRQQELIQQEIPEFFDKVH